MQLVRCLTQWLLLVVFALLGLQTRAAEPDDIAVAACSLPDETAVEACNLPEEAFVEACSLLQTDFKMSATLSLAESAALPSDEVPPLSKASPPPAASSLFQNTTPESEFEKTDNLTVTLKLTRALQQDSGTSGQRIAVDPKLQTALRFALNPGPPESGWPLVLLVTVSFGSFCALVFFGRCCPQRNDIQGAAVASRDSYPDHVKWILSGFVCFGHMSQLYDPIHGDYQVRKPNDTLRNGVWSQPSTHIFLLTHLFMMQTFSFYSGLYSQNCAKSQKMEGYLGVLVPNRKSMGSVLNILLVAEILRLIPKIITGLLEGKLKWEVLESFPGANWYIYALFMWRLLVPLILCLQYPVATSFLCALIPSCHPMNVTITRTFRYLPFFVMGLRMEPSFLAKTCSNRGVQASGVAFLSLMAVLMRWHVTFAHMAALVMFISPGNTGSEYWGILYPIMYYIAASLSVASLLSAGQLVFSGSWGWILNNMSSRSLYNYLTHPYILNAWFGLIWQYDRFNLLYMLRLAPWQRFLYQISLALLVLQFLTCWPTYYILSSICEPSWAAQLFVPPKAAEEKETNQAMSSLNS